MRRGALIAALTTTVLGAGGTGAASPDPATGTMDSSGQVWRLEV